MIGPFRYYNLILVMLITVFFPSCRQREKHKAQTPVPIRFDREWKLIQSAKSDADEESAVSKFIAAVHNERRSDSTGISYGMYYSYEDIKINRRQLSALFENNAEDSLKTVIIEIAPLVDQKIMVKQIYKDWKPKDLRILRYFMDR